MKKLSILCTSLFVLSSPSYASVVQVTEPSPLILLGLGIIALGISRKIQHEKKSDLE